MNGTVYLLHFDQPYKHARHYVGWAQNVKRRLAEHAAGRGARLLAVVREAGIGWQLARMWPGGRARERQIKRQGGHARKCPLCGVRPRCLPRKVNPQSKRRTVMRNRQVMLWKHLLSKRLAHSPSRRGMPGGR